jgi:hypothetical protein
MDSVMLSVTFFSLVMGVAMAVLAGKLLWQERRRSEARIASLAQMSEEPVPEPAPQPVRRAAARTDLRAADLPLRDPASGTIGGLSRDLFTEHVEPSPWPRRLIAAGAIAGVLLALVAITARAAREPELPVSTLQAAAPAPLELLSLRHDSAATGLVITGLVQNPQGGTAETHVVATVFAFAQDGTFLASGRAPIEVATLEPGDQSPFVVTVPATGTVARYRVGFRADDGRVLAHVDKRQPESIARR